MKFSFMTFACPHWPLIKIIQAAQQVGYHGIELRCDANHHHGVEVWTNQEERREIAALLQQSQLECSCLATSLQLAGEKVFDEAPARIQLASEIGARGLRVFCGPMPPGANMSQTINRVGEQLRLIADLAEQAGVELWLETHDTMSLAADAAAAVRVADHAVVGITYDNMHPFRRGETVAETFRHLGKHIRHVHFHDAMNRPAEVIITPMGQGEMPIDKMFAALLASGYDGYVSGEWFHDQYGEDHEQAVKRFHDDIVSLAQRHGVAIPK